jgi:hypothetical protein
MKTMISRLSKNIIPNIEYNQDHLSRINKDGPSQSRSQVVSVCLGGLKKWNGSGNATMVSVSPAGIFFCFKFGRIRLYFSFGSEFPPSQDDLEVAD